MTLPFRAPSLPPPPSTVYQEAPNTRPSCLPQPCSHKVRTVLRSGSNVSQADDHLSAHSTPSWCPDPSQSKWCPPLNWQRSDPCMTVTTFGPRHQVLGLTDCSVPHSKTLLSTARALSVAYTEDRPYLQLGLNTPHSPP